MSLLFKRCQWAEDGADSVTVSLQAEDEETLQLKVNCFHRSRMSGRRSERRLAWKMETLQQDIRSFICQRNKWNDLDDKSGPQTLGRM